MWSDRETEHDLLGFQAYVSVLAEIAIRKDLAPLAVGIFGAWGSGKTSLMKMLKARVDEEDRAKTLWFNAWRYEGRDEAQSALIHAILAKLNEDKSFLDTAKDTVDRIKRGTSVLKLAKHVAKSVMTMTPDIGGLLECFTEHSEELAQTMEQFESDFHELLEKAKIGRIAVFIDDLDRCTDQKVIEVFETIKLFLNVPECTFLIGADAAKIEQAVGSVFSVPEPARRKDYLEKIIQIPFNIPEQTVRDIGCYVGMLILYKHLSPTSRGDLVGARPHMMTSSDLEDTLSKWCDEKRALFPRGISNAQQELKEIMPYVALLARGLRGNPRQVKRFLNVLSLRRDLAAANHLSVTPGLLVKTTVLEYVWSDFFEAMAKTVDPETGKCELLAEIEKATKDEIAIDSSLLAESMKRPELVRFLEQDPRLGGDINLEPYLFLAQTSLSRGQVQTLLPTDEVVRELVSAMQSDDQLVSRAGARRAAASEPGVATSVVQQLTAYLPRAKEDAVATRLIAGLAEVCRRYPGHYRAVVDAIAALDPAGRDAVAVAATTLFAEAEGAQCDVGADTRKRFEDSSQLARALSPRGRKGRG